MLYVNARVKLNTYSVINSNIELRLVSIYREIVKKKGERSIRKIRLSNLICIHVSIEVSPRMFGNPRGYRRRVTVTNISRASVTWRNFSITAFAVGKSQYVREL